ncbi:MAG: hypothetical protein K0S84_1020, partial [Nitrososphaera sp.]|nr:hypothetical protein [Nitrososphaera sp.]
GVAYPSSVWYGVDDDDDDDEDDNVLI